MKKLVVCILAVAAIVISGSEAQASKLPDQLWQYIKGEIPGAVQRFDSVVTVSKDVMYIPLYPAQKEEVEKLEITYSYPQMKALRQMPEVVIFNNNYVLLKCFKNKKGDFTITENQDLPLKVKLGIMPQDMLVPIGLNVPDGLKPILGDLNIPLKSDNSIVISHGGDTPLITLDDYMDDKTALKPLRELKNKKLYITASGSKFMMVYDNESKKPLYELKLNALPSNIVASNHTKFALVTYYANKNIEIIDLQNERVLTQIAIDDVAKDADIDEINNIAYVSVPAANTIYAVDLNSGKLSKTIKLSQSPGKLAVSTDGTALAFIDNTTQDVCSMSLSGDYLVKPLAQAPNTSKIIFHGDNVYSVSRVKNKMDIHNAYSGALLDSVKLSKKPIDAVYHNGMVYILCAQDGAMDIYDTAKGKLAKTVNLGSAGFFSKITSIPNQSNALLTGMGTNKCLVFDFDNMKVVTSQPFEVKVSNIMVVDK